MPCLLRLPPSAQNPSAHYHEAHQRSCYSSTTPRATPSYAMPTSPSTGASDVQVPVELRSAFPSFAELFDEERFLKSEAMV